MSLTSRRTERDSLAGRTWPAEFNRLVAADETWGHIRAFAERWGQDPLSTTRIPFVFLEFDAQRPHLPAPPSVFVALDWFLEELTLEARRTAGADPSVCAPGLRDAREIAETLAGRPLAADVSERLKCAFMELPPAALVLHVGVMLGRARRSVRLSVAVPHVEVVKYLARVGWCGDTRGLGRTIDLCASACGLAHPQARLQADFDLEDGLSGAVGIGLTPDAERSWQSVLHGLSDVVSCDDEKLSALGAWPGHVVRRVCERDVPLERYLSHLKLAWKPDGVVAKGYFGASWSGNPGA